MYKIIETAEHYGHVLHKIEAIDTLNFGDVVVAPGTRGGKENLGPDAWLFDNAMVFGNAKVYDRAIIYGNAQVYGRVGDESTVPESLGMRKLKMRLLSLMKPWSLSVLLSRIRRECYVMLL